jgi:hypothetical protein
MRPGERPGWVAIVRRLLAAVGAMAALTAAFLSFVFSSCHDSGGFCAGEKTSSDAWESAASTGISLAVAGAFLMVAFAVPRRHWLLAGALIVVLSVAAAAVAYAA